MKAELTEVQRAALRALCDTFVPSLRVPNDPGGFWARAASDLGVDHEIANSLQSTPGELRAGVLALLDRLVAKGFIKTSANQREGLVGQLARSAPEMAKIVAFIEKQILLLNYGLPASPEPNPNLITYGSPSGQNPNWEIMDYPGPVSVPRDGPKRIQTIKPGGDHLVLDAGICVVGSGAGGAVVAATLAQQGHRVVVLEAGGHYSSSDFHQLELWGYRHLWYRGGATPTANGTVNLLAGGTLGGGTEINWMNCVRTPDLVRKDWVRNYGLEGVDQDEFDYYMDAVEERISASSQTAYYNAQNLRMKEGCERLGYRSAQTHVNWAPELFNPLMAGYTGFGDQSGGKQTARRTYLLDAYRAGARILCHCHAERILVNKGRAAGIEATYSDGERTARVIVNAPQVVVACGSLESPALLLRTGIGGSAVGKYLHLQPGGAVYGVYQEKQKGWWGSPMTANCEEFTDTGQGYGFYMEIPAFGPGFVATVIPWSSGRQHKEAMTKVPYISTFIWFLRDRGHGQVTIDRNGASVATYELTDEVDQRNFRRASTEAIRIHEAAGAREILFSLAHRQLSWKRGQNLKDFIQLVMKQPLLSGAQPMISAHQLSTCRMGADPATSVANPNGELHDVEGVWVADASACPTALGANPMVTIMALAARTADRMAASIRPAYGTIPRIASDMVRGMVGIMMEPATVLKGMAGIVAAAASGNGSSVAQAGSVSQAPARAGEKEDTSMFSNIIELTAKPGQAKQLILTIRERALPQVIRPSEGWIDEIVLLSDSDPNHVTAISFWKSRADVERFNEKGFARVSALLQPYLNGAPQRRAFVVGASTNYHIIGWNA